jgi:hypothetical protein
MMTSIQQNIRDSALRKLPNKVYEAIDLGLDENGNLLIEFRSIVGPPSVIAFDPKGNVAYRYKK